MHGFWRVIIATVLACLWWKLPIVPSWGGSAGRPGYYRSAGIWLPVPASLTDRLVNQPNRGTFFNLSETALIATLPLIGIATYAGLSWWFPVADRTGHTCCRKCGYILRDLTEPRCPGCGEPI